MPLDCLFYLYHARNEFNSATLALATAYGKTETAEQKEAINSLLSSMNANAKVLNEMIPINYNPN